MKKYKGKDQQNCSSTLMPSLRQMFWPWLKIGFLSFGGPAAQIALMHRFIVEEKALLSEKQFLNALSFCLLLPGPEAMQLAIYSGWKMHGILGGLCTGLLFVMPGAGVVLALAIIYLYYGTSWLLGALFLGIKAAVLVVVIKALLRISDKALQQKSHWLIAGCAFIGLFFYNLPFPLIIICAGICGFCVGGYQKTEFSQFISVRIRFIDTLKTIIIWLLLWFMPLFLLEFIAVHSIFKDIGWFFSRLATITFGGAYAVLTYMAQETVDKFGWLSAGEMIDGLGLAETTPGPLILVTEFVGFLAAARVDNDFNFTAGILAAILTLWVTFIPCFLWVFVGAPYIQWIGTKPRLHVALTYISAAVVGVILNLSLWFALHVLFGTVTTLKIFSLRILLPDFLTINFHACIIVLLAIWLLIIKKIHLITTLLLCSLSGFLLLAIF